MFPKFGVNMVQTKIGVSPSRFYTSMSIWVFPNFGVFPPQWMVKIMEKPTKMDDLGGKPSIFGNIQIGLLLCSSNDSHDI